MSSAEVPADVKPPKHQPVYDDPPCGSGQCAFCCSENGKCRTCLEYLFCVRLMF